MDIEIAISVELKFWTPIGDYRQPVVTGGAEPQDADGITRVWIVDPKVFFGIPGRNSGSS